MTLHIDPYRLAVSTQETSRWTNVQIYSKKSFKLERDFVVLAKDKQGQIRDRFDLDGGMHAMIRFPNSGAAKL
eukprot:s3267_g1.t1